MMNRRLKNMVYELRQAVLILFVFTTAGCAEQANQDAELAYATTSVNAIKEIYDIPYYTAKDADSVKHKLNLFLPENVDNPPIMLWIHGGAWAFGGRKFETNLARNFASEGIAVAVMSYRLSPATWQNPEWDTGVEHPAHIRDVARAFSWVYRNAEQFGYDKYSIFVSGYSAGAHLSALLAMDPTYLTDIGRSVREIKGVIPIAGAYDMVSYYHSHVRYNGQDMADSHVKGVFGQSMEQIRQASPTEYVDNQWVPMLVISETETYDYTRLLEQKAKAADYDRMEFYHVRDKNHSSLLKDLSDNRTSDYKRRIIDYIKTQRADYNYLDRGDFKLAYKQYGEGEPLFLLNGGPGFSSHNFQQLASKIADNTNRQVILFDQRGTGYSEFESLSDTNITLDLMVKDLEALRQHLGLDRIALMGQSFGGIYAMAYAASYPELVDKIILSHSGGMSMDFMDDVGDRLMDNIIPEGHKLLAEARSATNPERRSMLRSRAISSGYVYDKSKRDIVYKGLAFNSQFYAKVNQLVWQDMRRHYDVTSSMQHFDKPVLIIHGDRDIVNPKHARHTHKTLPNSRLILLDKCVHYGWIDQPETYFDAIFDFLLSS